MHPTNALPHISGIHDCELVVDGTPVRVTLHLPENTRGAPLVLALHYGGQPHGFYGRGLLENLLIPAWEALGAVVVAPVSTGGDWQAADNTQVLAALLPMLESHYHTAAERRIITGYSLGAIGCWIQLAAHPRYFAAAVPIAGRVPESLATVTTPFHALHSRADQLFALGDFESRVHAHAATGGDAALTILDGIDHFDVTAYLTPLRGLVPWLAAVRL
jgi:predicted peptidase